MDDLPELIAAYQRLASDLDTTQSDREAVWATVLAGRPADEAGKLRLFIDWYLNDAAEEADGPEDGLLELWQFWKGPGGPEFD